ncbi:MAG TPA: TspO/MBR family protein [Sphingomicrobium sp.]|jgi:tryptophan-rich sensory protein|nr:TspO/MBR family protein [Sphingomicrobium sp.]
MNISAGNTDRRRTAFVSALLFVGIIVAVSLGIGYVTQPGEWYEKLAKPAFNPPSWVFGPVWTLLYILIAVAGWRIWRIVPRSSAMMLWLAQMVLNWLWSPIFFGAEAPWLAFAIIVAMLAYIIGFIAIARKYDRTSAGLFVPYAAWVTFATVLNGSIAMLNS